MSTSLYSILVAMLTLMVLLPGQPAAADDELASVKGRGTLDGQPLAAGKIVFHLSDGQFAGAKIKKDGMLWRHSRRKADCPRLWAIPRLGSQKRKWPARVSRSVRTASGGAFESDKRRH